MSIAIRSLATASTFLAAGVLPAERRAFWAVVLCCRLWLRHHHVAIRAQALRIIRHNTSLFFAFTLAFLRWRGITIRSRSRKPLLSRWPHMPLGSRRLCVVLWRLCACGRRTAPMDCTTLLAMASSCLYAAVWQRRRSLGLERNSLSTRMAAPGGGG